jgi:hypothetical protein
MDEGMGDGQDADHPGAVVACAWSLEPVAVYDRVEAGLFGKYGIDVRRENDNWAGALGMEVLGGQKSKDIADGVSLDLIKAGLGKASGKPYRSGFFAEWRRWNCHQVSLPIHDCFWISVKPGKSGMDGPLSGQVRYS